MNKKQAAIADKEGWAIFDASGSTCNSQGNWPFQVQKNDDGPLEHDGAAHAIIVEGAKEGKPHSLAALKFLRENSKPELDLILRGVDDPDVSWMDSILTNDNRLDALERKVFGKIVSRPGLG